MIKLKINVFILFFTFSTQTCATPKENENNHLYHINKNIYSIKFDGGAGLKSELYRLNFYPNNPNSLGESHEDLFRPISKSLRKIINKKSTNNPFKNSFKHIYTADNIAKRLQCPIKGVRLEIDNNATTKEWLIGFMASKCFNNKNLISKFEADSKIHQWILQQKANGKYRILMEAESELTYIENKNTYKGYKQIETSFSVEHTLPNYPLKCGDAQITWEYAPDNRYHIKSVLYNISDCRHVYLYNNIDPHIIEAEWEISMKEKVIAAVNSWILPLEGKVPVKTKNLNYIIDRTNKNLKKKPASNCTKNNAMHKAATRGDYRFIAQCLKKGENVNLVDKNGWTPLHSAARNGQAGVIQLLIKYKANINAKDKTGRTATDQANYSQHHHIVNFLKKKGGRTTR